MCVQNMTDTNFIVICPHCNTWIIIEEINCAIFRHGVNKFTQIQISPHLEKFECDKLFEMGLLYGCGKPFKIVINPNYDPTIRNVGPKDKENPKWIAEACDYI